MPEAVAVGARTPRSGVSIGWFRQASPEGVGHLHGTLGNTGAILMVEQSLRQGLHPHTPGFLPS